MDFLTKLKSAASAAMSFMTKPLEDKGIVGTVTTVIVAAVAIVIGAIIVAELFDGIDVSAYSTDAQTAINNTEDMAWAAFTILPVAIIVFAAVAVISAVLILGGA